MNGYHDPSDYKVRATNVSLWIYGYRGMPEHGAKKGLRRVII